MNSRAIFIVTGLMVVALIGLVILQANWIRTSVNLNKEQFDMDVRQSLIKVAEKLEEDEMIRSITNGWSPNPYGSTTISSKTIITGSYSLSQRIQEQTINAESHASKLTRLLHSHFCTCEICTANRNYNSMMQYANPTVKAVVSLEDRIKPKFLNDYLRKELQNRGINIDFEYGVYSRNKKSFVSYNDHFVVEDSGPKTTTTGYSNLNTSPYAVDLFRNEAQPDGRLMIFFPNKSSFIWQNALNILLSSILFIGIIVLSFLYTLKVIFTQKKVSEMKTDFINNMTHEFKTPIATISLAADSITSPMVAGSPEKIKRFASIIKQENKRMNNQVEKVLQIAKLDKQDFDLKLSEIDIHQVIRQAVENLSLQVEKKGGRIHMNLEASNGMIVADQNHISNMIHNLLDNANKYTPNKPEIIVSTKNVTNGVEIVIKDNGIGMSKEVRKHIFDRFFREHTGDIHDVKGFGLGLSYVKAMIEAHKGDINVRSEVGKGSSFILFLQHNFNK